MTVAVGAQVEATINGAFLLGSAMAGLAGILAAYDGSLTSGMGLRMFLLGVSAAIVGGVGTYHGALLGALLIGLIQNSGAIWLPTQWQDASVFLVLTIVLLVRPEGLLGRHAVAGAH